MAHLDNEMDELYKRAAENYPLHINPQGWESVAAALQKNESITSIGGRNVKKLIFSLFIILFFAIAILFYMVLDAYKEQGMLKKDKQIQHENYFAPIIKNSNEEHKKPLIKSLKSIQTKFYSNHRTIGASYKNSFTQSLSDTSARNSVKIMPAYLQEDLSEIPADSLNGNKSVINLLYRNSALVYKMQIDRQAIFEKNTGCKIVTLIDSCKEINNSLNSNRLKSLKKGESISSLQKKFFIGVAGTANFNEVKEQGANKVGYSFGIIGGYKFNKHFAIESGLLSSKIYYYSDGKYFNMPATSTSFADSSKMLRVDGSSNIIEIPVKLKYDFLTANKSTWFVTGSVTSYIITKQNNTYLMYTGGVIEKKVVQYNQREGNFAALASIGLGYERIIKNKTTIRIEPYIQTSLKGLGIGSMPVSGAGLRVGLFFHIGK